MSHWKRWTDDPNTLNWQFGQIQHPSRLTYPDLRDDSPLILASDCSGEHSGPAFQVLSFLPTPMSSVMASWEPARSVVRQRYLNDGGKMRRMSFKNLNDALR